MVRISFQFNSKLANAQVNVGFPKLQEALRIYLRTYSSRNILVRRLGFQPYLVRSCLREKRRERANRMAQRQRTMRLIAIPLARARPGATPVSTFLAQRVTQKGKEKALGIEGVGAEESKAAGQAGTEGDGQAKKEPLVSRLMTKASNFWISLGRTDVKSPLDWKRRTYTMGEKLMDRIEYEEWALKGVDPALGPSLDVEEAGRRRKDDKEEKAKQQAVASASESSSLSSTKTSSATSVGIGPPSPDNVSYCSKRLP